MRNSAIGRSYDLNGICETLLMKKSRISHLLRKQCMLKDIDAMLTIGINVDKERENVTAMASPRNMSD